VTRTVRRLAALLWAAAIISLPCVHASAADPVLIARTEPLRILALGDSITAGVSAFGAPATDGGYRGPLERALAERGYHAVFVGSRSDYSSALSDRAHEGWPGYVVRSFPSDPGPGQLYGNLTQTAMRTSNPDVVLVMAGTNDLLRREKSDGGYTLANIVESVRMLLEQIVAAKPSVVVILAPVVDSPRVNVCALRAFAGVGLPDDCAALNANLATLVNEFDRRGYRVSYARSMATAVPRDAAHFPDGIHPAGPGGYADVANVWLQAIAAITQPLPVDTAEK
jgi:lysophospholipase L1-like esterase